MQMPLQITFRGLAHSAALEALIRAKAAKLGKFHENITSCRVVVEALDRHRNQGGQLSVHLDLRVPEHQLVITRDHDADVHIALRDAFEVATRQIEEIARRERGEVKAHTEEGPAP